MSEAQLLLSQSAFDSLQTEGKKILFQINFRKGVLKYIMLWMGEVEIALEKYFCFITIDNYFDHFR